MSKQELVAAIAEKTGNSKKSVDEVLKAFTESVMDDVAAGNKVQLVGFGTFESVKRAAREGINPATGAKMQYPETVTPKFKPSKVFKNKVND